MLALAITALMACAGPTGPQGEAGPQGPRGETGAVGPQGQGGPQGPEGALGPIGPGGPEGPQGSEGEKGEQGPKGDIGPPGPEGEDGNIGPRGPQGHQGETGPEGPTGPIGPEGPQGKQGIQGPPGPAGGPTGPQGEQGPRGEPGASTIDASEVYEHARESVVCIQYQNRDCFGSGFYIDEQGTLITALHVIEELEQYDWVEIWAGPPLGQRGQYRVIKRFQDEDMAVLKRVEAPGDFPTQPLPIAEEYRVGEAVLAIGFPGQSFLQPTLILTGGILAAYLDKGAYPDHFLVDIVATPGSSGGALVNAQGQVMGVTRAIYPTQPNDAGHRYVAYTVASNLISLKPALAKLLDWE